MSRPNNTTTKGLINEKEEKVAAATAVRKGKRRKRSKSPPLNIKVNKLCELAEQALNELNYDNAAQYYTEAVELDSNNALLHHKLGVIFVETGRAELAHEAFLRSIELAPNSIPSNYLYIGQQCYGSDAVEAFTKAIELMSQQLNNNHNNDNNNNNNNDISSAENISNANNNNNNNNKTTLSLAQLRKEIARAHVSIGELYMTDLCEEDNAETECNEHLLKALQISPKDAEVHCALGELRLIQSNKEESLTYFQNALRCIAETKNRKKSSNNNNDNDNDNDKKKRDMTEKNSVRMSENTRRNDENKMKEKEEAEEEEENDGNEDEENGDNDNDNDNDELDIWDDMTIDSFLKLAKLGMELNEFDNVLKIVYGVLQCDDNVGEAWALGSLAHYRLNHFKEASIWFENANAILENEGDTLLGEILTTVKEAMDMEKLPDIASLNINANGDNDKEDEEDGEEENDDDDGEDENDEENEEDTEDVYDKNHIFQTEDNVQDFLEEDDEDDNNDNNDNNDKEPLDID